ncbi:NAD-dependent epimerase/dehydratase family protein [Stutzerimonas stutzeri]|uniref:NAD-dependent epimerase/dehydratase family protein n=1 Tax=Stutzerimonas stutzeri TaxID=316 RepID=UPI0015E3B3F9|nr:NAD-dependent epimerase/dehydratase family protein [Stutzerimonas stutzeri]MBA1277549.1 NAD-dependent epimerase/dehydratase family protein [Stutzerimonas stutzeri]
MNVLVVGGSGLLGGHAALYLQQQGWNATIASRNAPTAPSLAALPFVALDYTSKKLDASLLQGFDALLFCAGHDIRHVDMAGDLAAQWHANNSLAIPNFFAQARDTGIRRAVMLGSFYPQIAPELIDSNPYVRSRHESCMGVRALNTPQFEVMSVNAPFMVGHVPGLPNAMFEAYTRYAMGQLEGIPPFGPKGGTNFMSVQSLSEALYNALVRGEPGKAYLVGDENLSFTEYFQLFFDAAGNRQQLPELDQEHPLLPDSAIYTGRGNYARYEPDNSLGYRRGDVRNAVEALVKTYL